MSQITWAVAVDLDRNGSYETDLTGYVEWPGNGISIDRGVSPDGLPLMSRVTIALSNRSGYFTQGNTASPFFGKLIEGTPIRLTAVHNGTTYTRWSGFVSRWANDWASGVVPVVVVECYDIMRKLQDSPPIYVANAVRDADGALVSVMDEMDLVSGTDYTFLDGEENWAAHYEEGDDALTASLAIIKSELRARSYVQNDGQLFFAGARDSRGLSQWARAMRRLAPSLWLRFNERSGTVAYDDSGNTLNGAYVGSPTLAATGGVTADPNAAFTAASTKYVTVADNALLDPGDTFSISVLFKPRISAIHLLCDKGSGGYWLQVLNNQTIRFNASYTHEIATTTATVTVGAWNHIVVTKTGATTKIYLNGADVTPSLSNNVIVATASSLYIGRDSLNLVECDGDIDEFALFPDVVTAAEVATLYRAMRLGKWGDGTAIVPVAIAEVRSPNDWGSTVSVSHTPYAPATSSTATLVTGVGVGSLLFGGGGFGSSFTVRATGNSPYTALTTPVATTDYTGGSTPTATDYTANLTATAAAVGGGPDIDVTVTNTSGNNTYVTKNQVRGTVETQAGSSISFTFSLAAPWRTGGKNKSLGTVQWAPTSTTRINNWAYSELRRGRYPLPRLVLRFAGARANSANDTLIKDELLALELGDIVRYKDTALGVDFSTNGLAGAYVDDYWYVERIADDIPPDAAGQAWGCTVQLVPTWNARDIYRVAFDEFDRANAVGDLGLAASGHAWIDDTDFDISGDRARSKNNTVQTPSLSGGTLADDHIVEVSLSNISADADAEVGLAFRLTDASNYLAFYVDKGDSLWHLSKFVAAVETSISTGAWTPAATAELQAKIQDGRIRLAIDGVQVYDGTDYSIQRGSRWGLFARNASATVLFGYFYGEGL